MADKKLWVFYDSIAKIQSNPLSRDEAQSTILKIRPQSIDRFYVWTQGWQNWQPLKSYLESDQKVFVSTFTISRSNDEKKRALAKEIFEQTSTYTQTATSIPHGDNGPVSEHTQTHTGTNTKSYSQIMLTEETISRFLKIEQHEEFIKQFDADELTFSNIQKPSIDFSKILNKALDTRSPRHELKIEVLLISPRGKTFRTHSRNISLSGCLLEDTMPFEFYDNVFDIVVMSTINKDPKKARVKLQGKAVVSSGTRSQRLQYHNQTTDQKNNLQGLLEDYIEATKNPKAKAG